MDWYSELIPRYAYACLAMPDADVGRSLCRTEERYSSGVVFRAGALTMGNGRRTAGEHYFSL